MIPVTSLLCYLHFYFIFLNRKRADFILLPGNGFKQNTHNSDSDTRQ